MKITELDLQSEGKRYKCGNRIFKVKDGDLVDIESNAYLRDENISIAYLLNLDFEEIKKVKNPYKRVDNRERYYFVSERGVEIFKEFTECSDNELFNSSNYFNNKNYAEYVAFKETLMRKIDRFAWENNEKVIDWYDCSTKYYIKFEIDIKKFRISRCISCRSNDIYFTSYEIAEKALEEFKDDLVKMYSWEFDV